MGIIARYDYSHTNMPAPIELKLWTWLKAHELRQGDLAEGLGVSDTRVSRRINFGGFSGEERQEILAWARITRPSANVQMSDLFEPEGA
jgi:hypothetical protein